MKRPLLPLARMEQRLERAQKRFEDPFGGFKTTVYPKLTTRPKRWHK